MKIKIQATIEVHNAYGNLEDKEEFEWFNSLLNDKKSTMLILHSNEVGDEIGQTNTFEFEIVKESIKNNIEL